MIQTFLKILFLCIASNLKKFFSITRTITFYHSRSDQFSQENTIVGFPWAFHSNAPTTCKNCLIQKQAVWPAEERVQKRLEGLSVFKNAQFHFQELRTLLEKVERVP